MPTAPLFYQPLVQARVLATPIGDTTVFDAQRAQSEKTQKAYEQHSAAMDGILRGYESLQGQLPGSRSLDVIQFSWDEPGYIANRVATSIRLRPELFENASPDQAGEIGATLVQEAAKELQGQPGMRAVGDTLEVGPALTALFEKHWTGKEPLSVDEAAYLGVMSARELQRAVTPIAPAAVTPLQWIEDATVETLAMSRGVASRTVEALGIKADAAAVDGVVDTWREQSRTMGPNATAVRALGSLLGAAGIAGNDDAARTAAFGVLQSTPLDGVPLALAQAIVADGSIPSEAAPYIAGRIVETDGKEGNITGLLAELEQLRAPKDPVSPPARREPEEPPAEEPPAGEPPPTRSEPPADEPPAEDPPAGEPPPTRSEPPAEEPPAGEPPPTRSEPPAEEPPAEEPPAEEPPAEATP